MPVMPAARAIVLWLDSIVLRHMANGSPPVRQATRLHAPFRSVRFSGHAGREGSSDGADVHGRQVAARCAYSPGGGLRFRSVRG